MGPLRKIDERWLKSVTQGAVSPAPLMQRAAKPRRPAGIHMMLPGPWVQAAGAKAAHSGDAQHTPTVADNNQFDVLQGMGENDMLRRATADGRAHLDTIAEQPEEGIACDVEAMHLAQRSSPLASRRAPTRLGSGS